MTLTAGEWLAFGIGLGGLAATVTMLVWRTMRDRPGRRD